jgi:hypothetical protein
MFLEYYHDKHGEDKGLVHYLNRVFDEMKKPMRAVIKEAKAGGGFDLRIVGVSGKANEKHVSKIKFYVVSKDVRQYKDFGKIMPSTN